MDDLQARFDDLTRTHLLDTPLAGAFSVRCVEPDAWNDVAGDVIREALPREYGINGAAAFTGDETTAMRALDARLKAPALQHDLVFERDGAVVGVFRGVQHSHARYYMMFTAVRPAHQGRGLYKDLLGRLIAVAEGMGFREIYSRHHADNNQVLVPKLQRGFVIGGFEVSPKYGLIVELRKYLCEGQRRLHRYRIDATPEHASLAADGIVQD